MKTLEGLGQRADPLGDRDGQRLVVEPAQEILGALGDDDLAVIDDRDVVAQLFGFFEIVRRQEDGGAGGIERADMRPELAAQLDIVALSASPTAARISSVLRSRFGTP